MDENYDVAVIGGGAAGLSAGLALARARRSTLVIDAGEPRNAPAGHVHNYLGREGSSPADLLADGRAEIAGYGGTVSTGTVASAQRVDDGFVVTLDDGRTVAARRLIVTTGLVDELPEVGGLAERFGRDVLHCPYCHGWEVRDQPIAVLGTGPAAVHQALLWRQWSDDVTLLRHTAPDPTPDEWEQLAARGISVVDGEVVELDVVDGAIAAVVLRSGTRIPCRAVVVAPRFVARAGVLASLGLEVEEQLMGEQVVGSRVPADPMGATAVPGVWVAGNVTNLFATVIAAAAGGMAAAAAVSADLMADDTRRAVAAWRAADPFSAASERAVNAQVVPVR